MTIEEEFEQMMAGNDVELDNVEEEIEAEEEEVEEEGPETTEDDDAEDATETNEDTEQYDEEEAEAETDEDDDGQTDETEEGELEDEEENAQVDESKNDEADTEEKPAEEVPETTDGIDYKKFYEEVALAKFTANGKEVEGFKDPKDLIRSQQALHGLTQKMEAVKAYQPFIKPMKERKLLDDPAKFNLMMNLLDGDKEALKTVIRDMGIDTLELDTEEINYVPKNTLPTAGQLKLDETFEQARALGIDDKLATALGSWDNESFNEFVDNSAVSGDLINHINTGAYDLVQDEIRKMSMLDTTGRFTGQSTINQYKQAAAEVAARLQANANAETAKEQKAKLEEEKAKLAKEQEEAEFKAKAKEKEAKVTAERKKAASVSKKKKVVKKAPNKEVDPVALKGDDFRKHFEQMLMS
jgi:hypothetical protein